MQTFKTFVSLVIYTLVLTPALKATEVARCIACDATQMQQLAQQASLFGSLLVYDPNSQEAGKYLVANHRQANDSSVAVAIYLPPKEQAYVAAASALYHKMGDQNHLLVTLDLSRLADFQRLGARELYANRPLKKQLGSIIAKQFKVLAQDNDMALLMMQTMVLAVDAMLKVDLSMTLIVKCYDSSQIVYKVAVKNALLAEHQANDSRNIDSQHQMFATH